MKRTVSFLLVLVICCVVFPQTSFAATTPRSVNVNEAEEKIYELFNILGDGSYFTVNQKTCCEVRESGHGCSNCSLKTIIAQTWFKNKFGTLSTDLFPKTYYSNTNSWEPSGRSCFAFATFAEWYIYASSNTDKVTTQCVGTFKYNYDGVSANIRVGDLIRLQETKGSTSGHSAIVISYNESGVKVLDCNGTGKNCEVHIRTIKYSSAYNYYVISRATNSVICEHQYNDCGYCTNSNCTHRDLNKHANNYNNLGVCTSCSYEYNYGATKSTAAAGVYKVTVNGGINQYTKPYSAAGTAGGKIAKGAIIEVVGSVKNHHGNTWLEFKYNNQSVYTSADNVSYVSLLPQSISCSLEDPAEGQKIVKGSHPVKGSITSKYYPLQEVKAYLDGTCFATITLGNTMTLDIRRSDINAKLSFGSLSLGSHTLVIKARDT